MNAADIMSKPVITVGPDATLEEVARLMVQHNIGCIPVIDPNEHLLGIITESNFVPEEHALPFTNYRIPELFGQPSGSLQQLESAYSKAKGRRAREVMKAHDLTTAREDTPVADLADLMVHHGINHIPILRDRKLVGIVTRHDLLRMMSGRPTTA